MKFHRIGLVAGFLLFGSSLPSLACVRGIEPYHDWTVRGFGGEYGLSEVGIWRSPNGGFFKCRDPDPQDRLVVTSTTICLGCCRYSVPIKAWQVAALAGLVAIAPFAGVAWLSRSLGKRRLHLPIPAA